MLLSHRTKRLFDLAIAFFSIASWVFVGRAQTVTGPSSLFQYSSLTGSGNTITATRVPVITAAGTTIYKDIVVQFDVDADGNLTLTSGSPQIADAPPLIVSSFKAGTYVGPSTILNGKALITVSGPGVSAGGATTWSLTTPAGSNVCTFPSSATWYEGPSTNSPLADRLTRARITSTAWSYGIIGSAGCSGSNAVYWVNGSLIGVSQTGNTLTIASFSDSGGNDKSTPLDQITYTLAP